MQTERVATLRAPSRGEILPLIGELAVAGHIDYASWLTDDVLLLVGWCHIDETAECEVYLVRDDRPHPIDASIMSYARENLPLGDALGGKVMIVRFEQREKAHTPLGTLAIRNGGSTFALNPADLRECVTDLQTLSRNSLAGLTADARTAIIAFVLASARTASPPLRLSRSLFALREALRERLPYAATARDEPQGLYVDTIIEVDFRSFYIRGWLRDAEARVVDLAIISPEGDRVPLLERAFFYPRADVAQFYGATTHEELMAPLGFISYFTTETPSYLGTGWTLEMRNDLDTGVEMVAPPIVQGNIEARTAILESLPHHALPNESLMAEHVFPAMSLLQEARAELLIVDQTVQFGTPSAAPKVSIVVPLYQRIDFVEQQLAQFADDPDFTAVDLIYVLDSPELATALRNSAAQLYLLYRVPFRIVLLRHNVGFSAANNAGIHLARGRMLLLLNSDILPDRPGWLGAMIAFYDATPKIGALGPKLLYEDDSLQHAGMYFYRPAGTLLANLWQNLHYYKGLHRDVPAANIPRAVPALTGACMMIDRQLYDQVGGLQDTYLQGDHEDSDLCLRLIDAGRENWYFPRAELYHLEAQSYPGAIRGLAALYNRWLHTRLWDEKIEEAMRRFGHQP